jgi:hypothetical protein
MEKMPSKVISKKKKAPLYKKILFENDGPMGIDVNRILVKLNRTGIPREIIVW